MTPVWVAGRAGEMNLLVGFRAVFRRPPGQPIALRIAAASRYRVFLNGAFVAHGPTRGPHGFHRIDVWDLSRRVQAGPNTLAIEVAGYNSNSFYLLDERSFLAAEILAGEKVLAATGETGFDGFVLAHRVQKVQRYSFQRPFSEVWRLDATSDAWRTGGKATPATLTPQPALQTLDHHVPLPTFPTLAPKRTLSAGKLQPVPPPARPWKDRSLTGIGPALKGFPERELETVPSVELQALSSVAAMDIDQPYDGDWSDVPAETWTILDFGRNVTGFPGLTVKVDRPTTLFLTFDEILSMGDVDFKRLGCVNIVRYDLEPGEVALETFEPYTLRYLKLMARRGSVRFQKAYLRELICPDADRATFKCSDPQVNQIFEAARETFKQNTLDIFMDCPSRERAGWLCDSYWTARVALDLTGHTRVERNVFENYALPSKFAFLPDGMLPMCYPSDHNDGVFIANWALWFVLQLEEYAHRGGDVGLIESLKLRVRKLFDYLQTLRNPDGLLEKVPGWVFVEWSRANDFVQDVNYPSNMLFAAALDAAGRLYGREDWQADAAKLRATIRDLSFDGTWFVDNAVRKDGRLARTENRSETCQYYAFYFGVATPQTHADLWKTLLTEFGPERKEKGLHPDIYPSNAFIGNYLRIELLARAGKAAQILDETRSFFGYMAERTGTLWENVDAAASCNHGFASHIAHVLYRDVLGVTIDRETKTVHAKPTDVKLEFCEGAQPVDGGLVKVSWKVVGGKRQRSVVAPAGWKVVEG